MMELKIPIFRRRSKKSVATEKPSTAPRVMSFWSPKATGKTILAAALAAALGGEGQRVACVDYDLLTPSLPGRGYGLDQVIEDILRGDFDPYVTALKLPCLKPARVHLLSGPTDPVRAEALREKELLSLVNALAENYDTVIIDTNQTLAQEATLVALDAADLIIVPVTPKENVVRHISRFLGIMENGLCIDMQKVRLVANQALEKAVALSTRDIERVLGRKVATEIPHCQQWENWNGGNLPLVDGRENLLLSMVNTSILPEGRC